MPEVKAEGILLLQTSNLHSVALQPALGMPLLALEHLVQLQLLQSLFLLVLLFVFHSPCPEKQIVAYYGLAELRQLPASRAHAV